jgi:hypothetical protein
MLRSGMSAGMGWESPASSPSFLRRFSRGWGRPWFAACGAECPQNRPRDKSVPDLTMEIADTLPPGEALLARLGSAVVCGLRRGVPAKSPALTGPHSTCGKGKRVALVH